MRRIFGKRDETDNSKSPVIKQKQDPPEEEEQEEQEEEQETAEEYQKRTPIRVGAVRPLLQQVGFEVLKSIDKNGKENWIPAEKAAEAEILSFIYSHE